MIGRGEFGTTDGRAAEGTEGSLDQTQILQNQAQIVPSIDVRRPAIQNLPECRGGVPELALSRQEIAKIVPSFGVIVTCGKGKEIFTGGFIQAPQFRQSQSQVKMRFRRLGCQENRPAKGGRRALQLANAVG